MARGRMFDRAFMKSRKVQSMTRDHRLVYASILPFLDREGRIIAEPLYLKANVFRHSDFTIEEIADAIRSISDAGLADLYADEDNEAIIQYTRFQDFNTPNSKEAKSDLPGPGSEGAMPCREPLITHAHAMHVQSTGNASGERNVNGSGKKNEKENVNYQYSANVSEHAPASEPEPPQGLPPELAIGLLTPHIPKHHLNKLGPNWINNVLASNGPDQIEIAARYASTVPDPEPDLLAKILDGRLKPPATHLAAIAHEYRQERAHASPA